MNLNLLSTLTILLFAGSKVSGIFGYPSTSLYEETESLKQDSPQNLVYPFYHNSNEVNADLEELDGKIL